MPVVQVIPAITQQLKRQRVAAYCRVSSDSEDQLNSFSVQVEHYTHTIQENAEWDFAGIYADEAVTGTRTDKRDEFQRMLTDCKAGKIDRILVKSISRFARNIADCIQTVRELKQLGVSVEFEKEQIDTSSMGGEMLLSMLSAAAQEESLSISSNLKWGIRKRMQNGDFITCRAPYGYHLHDNLLEIDREEAEVVRFIFNRYLSGMGIQELAEELENRQIPSRWQNHHWTYAHVQYILSNEKYIGDALVQKKYTPDFLPFRLLRNQGEVPQFYIENSHPAIIPREQYEKVQVLMERKKSVQDQPKEYLLSRRVICDVCGATCKRRVTHSQTVTWVCRKHFEKKEKCPTKAVTEKEIQEAFVRMYDKLLEYRESILLPMTVDLEKAKEKRENASWYLLQNQQIAELMRQYHTLTKLRAKGYIDAGLYLERTTGINQQLAELRRQIKLSDDSGQLHQVLEKTKFLLEFFETASPIYNFDQDIFQSVAEQVRIREDGIRFVLVNGLCLTERRLKL